jgi:hypothetical protein
MQTKEFYDLQHAKSYLQGSIIRYRKRPIYITRLEQGKGERDYLIKYLSIGDIYKEAEPKIGNFPDDAFDLNPVPLGMVNIPGGAVYYVERMPVRQWKIGLTSNNARSQRLIAGEVGVDHRHLIHSKEMDKTIRGKYPKVPDILRAMHPSAAFSRRFAIHNGKLLYRTRGQVGNIVRGQLRLNDKFFFLKEVLMEDLNG